MKAYLWISFCLAVVLGTLCFPWESVYRVRAGRTRTVEDAVADLGSKDYETRGRAQNRLVSLGAAARSALMDALDSPDAEVRHRAAAALHEIDRPEVSPEDRRLEEYRRLVRIGLHRADALEPGTSRFEALSLSPALAAQAAVAVAERYEDEDLAHQRAVRLLLDLERPEGAAYLSGLLARGYFLPSTVHLAAEGLSRFGGPAALPDLRVAVAGEDPFARRHALRVLEKLGGFDELPLIRLAAADAEADVRAAAAATLARLGGHEAFGDLARLARDPEGRVRSAALAALGDPPRPAARPLALEALTDPEDGVRASGLRLLRSLGSRADANHARRFLADPSPRVRGEAVRTLAALGGRARAVAAGVKDASPAVRREALMAARSLNPAERTRALAGMPEETDPYLSALRESVLRAH